MVLTLPYFNMYALRFSTNKEHFNEKKTEMKAQGPKIA